MINPFIDKLLMGIEGALASLFHKMLQNRPVNSVVLIGAPWPFLMELLLVAYFIYKIKY